METYHLYFLAHARYTRANKQKLKLAFLNCEILGKESLNISCGNIIIVRGVDNTPRLKKAKKKKRKDKGVGIEAIVKPGYEALYVRGAWMKKLKDMDKPKRKTIKKRR